MIFEIRAYDDLKDRDQVISLWRDVFGYEADHNVPDLAIDKKLEFNDGLFFVAADGQSLIGTVMAGYDGHRGWIYAMAVTPRYQKRGVGSKLLSFAEEKLTELGCMKINLQIIEGNEIVLEFYRSNGYQSEKRISMGKKIPKNIK